MAREDDISAVENNITFGGMNAELEEEMSILYLELEKIHTDLILT
jgi:hypothetical protein